MVRRCTCICRRCGPPNRTPFPVPAHQSGHAVLPTPAFRILPVAHRKHLLVPPRAAASRAAAAQLASTPLPMSQIFTGLGIPASCANIRRMSRFFPAPEVTLSRVAEGAARRLRPEERRTRRRQSSVWACQPRCRSARGFARGADAALQSRPRNWLVGGRATRRALVRSVSSWGQRPRATPLVGSHARIDTPAKDASCRVPPQSGSLARWTSTWSFDDAPARNCIAHPMACHRHT